MVDTAIRIHRALGPGLLETVYETVLADSLSRAGVVVERQKPVGFEFEGRRFSDAFRADIIVDHRLIIEIKSVERLAPVHAKQVLTYLRLMQQPVGLLLNFGGEVMKDGIKRIVNNYDPLCASAPLRENHSNRTSS
ncbi:MAG: GxxExxY protein [Sphingopyxis sp.]|nr:GxxExxY protein [Sphingopyxis sp.]